jgi:hypothetical protein
MISHPTGYYLERENNEYSLYKSGTKIQSGEGPGCLNSLEGNFAYLNQAGARENGTLKCTGGKNGALAIYTCVDSNGEKMDDCCGEYDTSNTGATRRLITANQAKNSKRTTVVNTNMMSCDEPKPIEKIPVQQDYLCKNDKLCHGTPRGSSGGFLSNSFQPASTDNNGLGTNGVWKGSVADDPCGGICDMSQTTLQTYYATGSNPGGAGDIPDDLNVDPWKFNPAPKGANVCDLINNNNGCNTVKGPVLSKLGKNDGDNILTKSCWKSWLSGAESCNYDSNGYSFTCNLVGMKKVPGTILTAYGVPTDKSKWTGGDGWCDDLSDTGTIIGKIDPGSNPGIYGFDAQDLACSIKVELTSKNPEACG